MLLSTLCSPFLILLFSNYFVLLVYPAAISTNPPKPTASSTSPSPTRMSKLTPTPSVSKQPPLPVISINPTPSTKSSQSTKSSKSIPISKQTPLITISATRKPSPYSTPSPTATATPSILRHTPGPAPTLAPPPPTPLLFSFLTCTSPHYGGTCTITTFKGHNNSCWTAPSTHKWKSKVGSLLVLTNVEGVRCRFWSTRLCNSGGFVQDDRSGVMNLTAARGSDGGVYGEGEVASVKCLLPPTAQRKVVSEKPEKPDSKNGCAVEREEGSKVGGSGRKASAGRAGR